MPYKHWVGGSNPSATTNCSAGHGFVARFFFQREFLGFPLSDGLLPLVCGKLAEMLPGFCETAVRFCRKIVHLLGRFVGNPRVCIAFPTAICR